MLFRSITDKPEELLNDSFDCLIKNPGIRRDHVAVVKARDELKIPVINEVETAYPFISKNVKIIGITGSNGKTTTTTMIHEIMKKAELPVHLGGNIGFPVTSLVNTLNDNDILLLEISDHQLVDMYDFKTNISVLTNISQVHLDFHHDFDQYKEMKKKIFNHHNEADLAILNGNDKEVELLTNDIKSKKEYFQTGICQIKNKAIYYGEEEIIKLDDIAVRGMHNYENIMAAIMVVKEFNVSNEVIVEEIGRAHV